MALLLFLLCQILYYINTIGGDFTSNSYSRYGANYHNCNREPLTTHSPPTLGTNGFKIKLSGNPERYVPREMYTVVLQGDPRISKSSTSVHKFEQFMLVVEPKEWPTPNPGSTGVPILPDVGTFQLYSDSLSKLSEDCPNAIVQTSLIPKVEISVMWIAPSPGSGCVVFKAYVVERKDLWYKDSGGLVKELCEEESESHDEQPEIMDECCACDEAKYEVTFEGLWSKYTHPKDFPSNFWFTHFSDIIGASHSADFRMWEYGGYASEGVRQVAETGVTKKLESELKAESNKIRTIIKARGLWHPNLNGKTFAVFRVDSKHHLMSLLSMLGPSPDWIVGVSALELCLKNCSWVTEKVMNLYLWDAGTDSGITYSASNNPTIPQERIKRITSSWPNFPESPFYDPTGTRMKPFAKLTVSRQRIYEKQCGDPPITVHDPEEGEDRHCVTTKWTEFTTCSTTCGHGIRMRTRNFIHEQRARQMNCFTNLVEKENCEVKCINNVSCATTSWSEWQECSVTCGKGFRTRTRKFMDRMARKICSQVPLSEKEVCMASVSVCENNDDIDPKCSTTQWSEWSPCTETCGKGMKIRTRLYLSPRQSSINCNIELFQKIPCFTDKTDCNKPDMTEAKERCTQSKEVGQCRGYYPRYYYDEAKGMCLQFIYGGCRGNKNNFERHADCKRLCEDTLKKDFVQASLPPSIAYAYAMKDATVHLETGLVCAPIGALTSLTSGNAGLNWQTHTQTQTHSPLGSDQPQPVIDCVVTPWGQWTPCSRTCGRDAFKERRREIKLNPLNGGQACPTKMIQKRKCKHNPPCAEYNTGTYETNKMSKNMMKHKHYHQHY